MRYRVESAPEQFCHKVTLGREIGVRRSRGDTGFRCHHPHGQIRKPFVAQDRDRCRGQSIDGFGLLLCEPSTSGLELGLTRHVSRHYGIGPVRAKCALSLLVLVLAPARRHVSLPLGGTEFRTPAIAKSMC